MLGWKLLSQWDISNDNLGKKIITTSLFSRALVHHGLFSGNHPHSWPQDSG